MPRYDENNTFNTKPVTTDSRFSLWEVLLIAILLLCIYGAVDPSAAGDLVDAVGKAVGR